MHNGILPKKDHGNNLTQIGVVNVLRYILEM